MCLDVWGVRSNQFGSSNVPPKTPNIPGNRSRVRKQLCTAGRAEIDSDPLSASFRDMSVSRRSTRNDLKASSVEDGFDQVRRSSRALTEFAVAIGDPQGLGTGCVPDSPAKSSALIKLHFKLHLADHSPTLPGSSIQACQSWRTKALRKQQFMLRTGLYVIEIVLSRRSRPARRDARLAL